MVMNKSFLERDTNISVKVLRDSISEKGDRITSFELEYPRFLHCELMTHRVLSRNSSSSRAIPISSMIEYTMNNMAMPVFWGKKKKGMQASEEINPEVGKFLWSESLQNAVQSLKKMDEVLLHKQIANRILEPFQMMKVVVTATDLDNFWNLRFHQDTLPEFVMLVHKMYIAMQESVPNTLRAGEWHLPYVEISTTENPEDTYYFIYDGNTSGSETSGYNYEIRLTLEQAKKWSAAYCASVSYRTERLTENSVNSIFDMLVKAEVVHSSPMEHQGTPIKRQNWSMNGQADINLIDDIETWEEGITHLKRDGNLCSGNLTGYIQYRHLLWNNTCYDFDYEKRLETFNG